MVLVGQRKALAMALRNDRARKDFQVYSTDLSQAKLILAGGPIETKCERVRSQFDNGFARRMDRQPRPARENPDLIEPLEASSR